MARAYMLTWVAKRRGWLKKYQGKMYSVSTRQLGTDPTKEASWRAARAWWTAKQAEIDATPKPEDPQAGYRAALAQAAAYDEFCRTGTLPGSISVDLGDDR